LSTFPPEATTVDFCQSTEWPKADRISDCFIPFSSSTSSIFTFCLSPKETDTFFFEFHAPLRFQFFFGLSTQFVFFIPTDRCYLYVFFLAPTRVLEFAINRSGSLLSVVSPQDYFLPGLPRVTPRNNICLFAPSATLTSILYGHVFLSLPSYLVRLTGQNQPFHELMATQAPSSLAISPLARCWNSFADYLNRGGPAPPSLQNIRSMLQYLTANRNPADFASIPLPFRPRALRPFGKTKIILYFQIGTLFFSQSSAFFMTIVPYFSPSSLSPGN